jgi:hypothetical protein
VVEISLPFAVVLCGELVKILPGVEPAIVAIVEYQAYRIVPNRFDGRDLNIFLAGLQDLLAGAMALDLC